MVAWLKPYMNLRIVAFLVYIQRKYSWSASYNNRPLHHDIALVLHLKYCLQISDIITMTSQWAQWRLVSNHQPLDCLLNCVFTLKPKKTSKLRVTGLCVGNSPVTGEFPSQMASNADNVSSWWRHHILIRYQCIYPDSSNKGYTFWPRQTTAMEFRSSVQ